MKKLIVLTVIAGLFSFAGIGCSDTKHSGASASGGTQASSGKTEATAKTESGSPR